MVAELCSACRVEVISSQRARSRASRAAAWTGSASSGISAISGKSEREAGTTIDGSSGDQSLQPRCGSACSCTRHRVELAEHEDLAGRAVGAPGRGEPEGALAVGDRVVEGQVAEGGAEPGGVDVAAVPRDGQGQAEEERGLLLVAPGGLAQRLQRVVTAEDRHQRLDGGRQPVAGNVGKPGAQEARCRWRPGATAVPRRSGASSVAAWGPAVRSVLKAENSPIVGLSS